MRLSRVLTSAVSSLGLRFTRLASDLFQERPDRLDRVELGGVSRQLEDRQPVPGRDQGGHCPACVGAQVIPDQDERAAELLAGGVQQAGAARLGEALALIAAAGGVDAADQPGPAPGPDGDQRGQ
jgi:hypothetical protein